ncbi:ankyrin 3 [Fusarium denticulatum]|uniref:Ankyrin 3 n=1 Tax=Fusarium denticulatum TaxID=48507 RepID=A0A8H5TI28_9HYPO|nr:ankyrin 3 [Fusarium denticulatum]
MLDDIHEDLPRHMNDTNTYTLGSVECHNIVVACLPKSQYGTNNAATVLTHITRTFTSICLCLMVGIGGGVPGKINIRLGDIVVGTRMIQYNLGKIVEDGQIQRTADPRSLNHLFGTALSSLEAKHEPDSHRIPLIIEERFKEHSSYRRPTTEDCLFISAYNHISLEPSCDECDHSKLVRRSERITKSPIVHQGTIASGNQVMKNSTQRDITARQLGAICFEMEAAGLMDILPCLPIRGICDYSDSHKNKEWQRYAAATAAAYARELLGELTVAEVQTKVVPAPNTLRPSFKVPFSLQSLPVSDKFVDRPDDRAALEQRLLPQQSSTLRRRICVLHGLPLALAQAASFLRETGIDVATYNDIYEQQWQRLMGSDNPLTDYDQGSIATTWAVSLDAIKRKSTDAINILRLWACLDNEQFWHGLLQAKSVDLEDEWLLRMGHDRVSFADAMSLLLRYSMIQKLQEPKGNYSMHPVVHRWVSYLDDAQKNTEFARLALILVSHSIPMQDAKEYWVLQRKLLPHAEKCWQRLQSEKIIADENVVTTSIHFLGLLYRDQGKLVEAEAMYKRALEGYEKALGRDHTSTLNIVHNLGLL